LGEERGQVVAGGSLGGREAGKEGGREGGIGVGETPWIFKEVGRRVRDRRASHSREHRIPLDTMNIRYTASDSLRFPCMNIYMMYITRGSESKGKREQGERKRGYLGKGKREGGREGGRKGGRVK
jgi:hypothetical protein